MQNKLEIGQRIRLLRESQGFSREELAEAIHVSPRFCYDLELGNKGMSVDTLCDLTRVLNTTSDYILFGMEGSPGNRTLKEELAPFVAVVQSCPAAKREYLLDIMSSYLQALR